MSSVEPVGAVLQRKTVKRIICYDCNPLISIGKNLRTESEDKLKPIPGEEKAFYGIVKQDVKTSIQPTMSVYHCALGHDDCRKLEEYLRQIRIEYDLEDVKQKLKKS